MRRAILLLVLAACGGDDAAPIDRTPGAPPSAMRFELRVVGGDRTLQTLARHAGAPEHLASSVVELIDRAIVLPPSVRAHVRGDGELRLLAVPTEEEMHFALAVPVGTSQPAELRLEAGGPRGTSHVEGAANLAFVPAQGSEPARLVAATTATLLEDTLPYLAFARFDARPEGMHVRFPERRFAEDARPLLERSARELVRQGRASLAAERARRDRPPALGDPEIVLDAFETLASQLAGYVADLGPTEITITTDAAGTHLRLRSEVEDSPLADALAAMPSRPLDAARFDEGTAIGLDLASDVALAPRWLALAGDRLDDDARGAIAEYTRAWPVGPRTWALGVRGGRRFAEVRGARAQSSDSGSPRRSSAVGDGSRDGSNGAVEVDLRSAFAREWMRALAGCTDDCASHALVSEPGRLAVTPVGTTPRSLAEAPDVARALRGEARLALVVDGARFAAWLDPAGRAETAAAAVVLRVGPERDALVIEVDATPGAIAPLVELVGAMID